MNTKLGKDKKQTPFELYMIEDFDLGSGLSILSYLIKRKHKYNGLLFETRENNGELSQKELLEINPKAYNAFKKYCSLNNMGLFFLSGDYLYETLKLIEKKIDFNSQYYLCVAYRESIDIILDYFNEWRKQNDNGTI